MADIHERIDSAVEDVRNASKMIHLRNFMDEMEGLHTPDNIDSWWHIYSGMGEAWKAVEENKKLKYGEKIILHKNMMELLKQGIRSRDPRVAKHAAAAMGILGSTNMPELDREVIGELINQGLAHPHPEVRGETVKALTLSEEAQAQMKIGELSHKPEMAETVRLAGGKGRRRKGAPFQRPYIPEEPMAGPLPAGPPKGLPRGARYFPGPPAKEEELVERVVPILERLKSLGRRKKAPPLPRRPYPMRPPPPAEEEEIQEAELVEEEPKEEIETLAMEEEPLPPPPRGAPVRPPPRRAPPPPPAELEKAECRLCGAEVELSKLTREYPCPECGQADSGWVRKGGEVLFGPEAARAPARPPPPPPPRRAAPPPPPPAPEEEETSTYTFEPAQLTDVLRSIHNSEWEHEGRKYSVSTALALPQTETIDAHVGEAGNEIPIKLRSTLYEKLIGGKEAKIGYKGGDVSLKLGNIRLKDPDDVQHFQGKIWHEGNVVAGIRFSHQDNQLIMAIRPRGGAEEHKSAVEEVIDGLLRDAGLL